MKARARRALGIRLEGGLEGRRRFLGRFDEADVRRELEEAGVMAALAARGYRDLRVRFEEVSGEYRLIVAPRLGSASLVELRVAEGTLPVTEAGLRARGVDVLSVIAVNWLTLQDPHAGFTPDRPPLPGQRYPGLGLGRRLYAHVLAWAVAWGKDALVNHPEYFHNARFYAPPFFFLAGDEQGRFEALCRDAGGLSMAEASAAVAEGRVREEGAGRVVTWQPGEMAAPTTDLLREWFASGAYRSAAAQACEAVRYRFSPPQSSQGQRPRSRRKL